MRLSYLSLQPYASYENGFVEGRTTYKLSVKYETSKGSIETRLGPDVATRVLAVIADEIVKESQEVAQNLTAEILIQANPPMLTPIGIGTGPNGQVLVPADDL